MLLPSDGVLIHLRSAPNADLEAAELSLALAAFDIEQRIGCSGSGILWLIKDQQSRKPNGKSPNKLINALALYDVETVYYRHDDLKVFGLTPEQLIDQATPINDQQWRMLFKVRHCLTF